MAKIKHYIAKQNSPWHRKGDIIPYTTGAYTGFPEVFEAVYEDDIGSDQFRRIVKIIRRIDLSCLGNQFEILIKSDPLSDNKRYYLQIMYECRCSKTGLLEVWKGRKWQLSEHMIPDEIIKTAYAAFEAAVKHEIMEGFKVDGKCPFNPHVPVDELLKISDREVKRD